MLFAMLTFEMVAPVNDSDSRPEQPSRPRVLLVEDEHVSRRALAALLGASGYMTDAVASAEEALATVQPDQVPLILLIDFNLPGMNGLDLIARLESFQPAVFPVLITAQGNEHLRAALRSRRVAYVQKPIDFNRLLDVIGHPQRAAEMPYLPG